MVTFKAGYYIDEFSKVLETIAEHSSLATFFEKHLYFTVTGLPDYIDERNQYPLLKVAWNIITRGAPTRVSIPLAESILTNHLGKCFLDVSSGSPDVELALSRNDFSDLEPQMLDDLLINFSAWTESTVSSIGGSSLLKVYRILADLIAAAQVQRTLLLIMLTRATSREVSVQILGLDQYLRVALVEDLNELFNNLNSLSAEEIFLPELKMDQASNVRISYGQDVQGAYCIYSIQATKGNYYRKVFTDRRVRYKELGSLVEREVDGRYSQNFEYYTPRQEAAMNYFLNNIFRKRKFRHGQESIINRALGGSDVIGLLPTGGGKSLTYQLCALLHPGVTIVVDPINSLMKDQYEKLRAIGIDKAGFINTINTKEERERNIERVVQSEYLILFVSPERFQIEKFRHSILSAYDNHVYFTYAVIDEAHCVSEWGHDFRHTYLKLAENLRRFCKPKSGKLCMFGLTATASFDVLADVQRELLIGDDAIITLPPEAIDRRELNFEIHKISLENVDSNDYWIRENKIGLYKYPLILNVIDSLPAKIRKFETQYGYFEPVKDFFKKSSEGYLNAGLIFCPTKSAKLKNGVLSLYDYLVNNERLDIGTYFGGDSNDTIKDSRIETQADLSVLNQDEFVANRKNLMIATKAFGMGIDKPNIRYSIHYSFPNSVEGFYQEAGRCGRDGNPSICSIIYHPQDRETNYDFYKNAFKGIGREIQIIDELLEEVRYEDNFHLGVVKRLVQDRYPEVSYMSCWNDRFLYINGAFTKEPDKKITIGRIDLDGSFRLHSASVKNFDPQKSIEICEFVKQVLLAESNEVNLTTWLNMKSTSGIKTLIEREPGRSFSLKIGFVNDTIPQITKLLKDSGNVEIEDLVVRAAYNFSFDGQDFLENLHYQYGKLTGFGSKLYLPQGLSEIIKQKFGKIRNSADTQRAIYRMSIVGIVDDYVIDYVGNFIEIKFKAKSDQEYLGKFRTYLKRYLGNQATELWLKKAEESNNSSVLQRVLYTLVIFIEEVIADKRKRSIDYMQQLCELGYEQGDKAFRENIVYYFTSKFARMEYLPKDTDGGRYESTEIVRKYLKYVSDPPDGLGGEIDNVKHLRGACANLRITMTNDNASIDLLTAYSLFALEAREYDTTESIRGNTVINDAIELYRKGFDRLMKSGNEKWDDILNLLTTINEKIVDINPVAKSVTEQLTTEVLLSRTNNILDIFLAPIRHGTND